MPQKKAKKAKIEKPKKASKPAAPQKKAAAGSVLKKAAKVVAKKVGAALNGSAAKKKPQLAKEAKKPVPAKLAKEAKLDKKAAKEAKKAVAPVAAPSKADLKKAAKEAAKQAKGKGAAPAPVAPAGKAGKKKGEIVLEMPAPKGVALLGREGKKKSKAEASVSSRKNRCREPGCEHETLLSGFCRLHYIKNWRKIKRKEAILASGQLNNYVEELVSKYPDKYLDVIRQDLASEKEWAKVVIDLELESADEEGSADEDMEGVAEGTGRREREFDDDSDTF
jgi:hypothetical protein